MTPPMPCLAGGQTGKSFFICFLDSCVVGRLAFQMDDEVCFSNSLLWFGVGT